MDTVLGVCPDMRSYASITFSMGFGAASSISTKQKVSSKISTDAELIAVDYKISKVAWAKRLTEAQGFKVNLNIVLQDGTSTIKLVENGKSSSGKRTLHFDICLFHVTDLISRKEVAIKCCLTKKMLSDYFNKPLFGKTFHMMRSDDMDVMLRE